MSRLNITAIVSAAVLGVVTPLLFTTQPVHALPDPSFRVTCAATGSLPDDPIVYPGQAGKSHQHTFYGAHTVNADTTTQSLLGDTTSACGRNYGTDRSAYWIPTLYKDGKAIYATDGSIELTAYYKRGGGPAATPVAQGFPQGLRMIAGDMHATTAQDNVYYKCAKNADSGSQDKFGHDFPSCSSDESLIAEIQFPDCWDGKNLDSADHKSHMAYNNGPNSSCPADHPVKLAKVFFEAKFYNVNGPASSFKWASGGQYTLHGDIFSAWDAKSQAALTNECVNTVRDCNPLLFNEISQASVTQAQMDAQTKWASVNPAASIAPSTPTATTPDHNAMDMPTTNTVVPTGDDTAADTSDDSMADMESMTDTAATAAETPDSLPNTGPLTALTAALGTVTAAAGYTVHRMRSKVSQHRAQK